MLNVSLIIVSIKKYILVHVHIINHFKFVGLSAYDSGLLVCNYCFGVNRQSMIYLCGTHYLIMIIWKQLYVIICMYILLVS